jgi:hypothetical protein
MASCATMPNPAFPALQPDERLSGRLLPSFETGRGVSALSIIRCASAQPRATCWHPACCCWRSQLNASTLRGPVA